MSEWLIPFTGGPDLQLTTDINYYSENGKTLKYYEMLSKYLEGRFVKISRQIYYLVYFLTLSKTNLTNLGQLMYLAYQMQVSLLQR